MSSKISKVREYEVKKVYKEYTISIDNDEYDIRIAIEEGKDFNIEFDLEIGKYIGNDLFEELSFQQKIFFIDELKNIPGFSFGKHAYIGKVKKRVLMEDGTYTVIESWESSQAASATTSSVSTPTLSSEEVWKLLQLLGINSK